jgi:hypothetical protein
MTQKPLPLIIGLKHWREQNGFSQSDAVKVLNNKTESIPFRVWTPFTPFRSTPVAPPRGSPASAPSHRNLDTPLKTRRAFFESRPSPVCRRGNDEALEYRASSCIRDIGIPLEPSLIHSRAATNPEMR